MVTTVRLRKGGHLSGLLLSATRDFILIGTPQGEQTVPMSNVRSFKVRG